ncbi:hypothetical protein CC85DRAFT_287095 [Cutaneotrichosporon oleaginosum]|uniref:Csf1 N-terminal domain-containing protein n=1 Tax=Cutaneotrichosporon oleaginosum TaxID=879819 RepID=A0A0J0XIG3_9TREE|nr:uncharacterized protein CC85DRAFT_287095 [Cutaneotrichosporon oleaginosum]KLT40822.1 hypothetical protein CC85DRAFT_287095 [Cutaneotrichosporon oleaginosum]TXT11866.1 hypothetical protein COLE_02276 [Cutaneotrichosporon oleaginosum]
MAISRFDTGSCACSKRATRSPPTRSAARLPCRIAAKLDGLEVFCFNRTPAYDAIVERMKKHEAAQAEQEKAANGSELSPTESASSSAQPSRSAARQRRTHPHSRHSSMPNEPESPASEVPKPVETRIEHRQEAETLSWLSEALPLEIKIDSGSVVLGSDATPMVLIVDYKRADGTIEISEPRSHCDLYRMSINMALSDVTVLMRTNTDYSGPLLAHGKRIYDDLVERDSRIQLEPPSAISSFPGFHWLAKRFDFLYDPRLSVPPVVGLPADRVWKGLARYRLPDEKVEGVHLHAQENQYAKVATILSTRALDFTYYSDTPGVVPEVIDRLDVDLNDTIGNIELPPEWGVDVTLHGGNVNYGPWTDRQRDALQKAFTPSIFFDSEPRARLKVGDKRLHAILAVNVNMTEKTTLRIPTREPSKDWQWDNAKPDTQRRYGWLDVEVGPNSSVGYTQSQIATQQGYDSMLMLHLDSLSIASSVNLQTFVVAKTCKLSMTMPNPLVWNAQRNWGIDITLDTPEIWLLREHIALIADLSKDWSSGTIGDFRHFVPMHYSFRFSLIKHIIHLYINDFNIVDVPRSKDHNAFMDIKGPRMDAYVAVASTRYRPEFSVVPFTVDAKNAIVELSLPSWDTHRTYGTPSLEVGRIGDIRVSGSYRYYARPQPDHVEKLKLHIEAEGVAFLALGWVIRRMFCVKDNYFGEFTQFSTMQEFLEKFDHSREAVGDPIEEKYRPGKSDPFAIHLTVDVRDSLVLLSDQIYSATKGIAAPVPQLQLDLKNNEYQMEMSLDIAPTYYVACNNIAQSYVELSAPLQRDQDVVFVEGVEIKANRLFGPQPQATTYVCLWEISVPRVSAFLSPAFKETLASVGTAVGYNWTDHDNAPASVYISETPPDATFVKVSVAHVTALLSSGNSGIAVELSKGLFIDTSSMASKSCRSVMGVGVPSVAVHVLHRSKQTKRWEPVGSVSTGLSLDTYKMPKGWEEEAAEQQKFLRKEDEPTRRIPYLYGAYDDGVNGRHLFDVYVPRPQLVQLPVFEPLQTAVEDDPPYESSDSETDSNGASHTISHSRIARKKRAQQAAREERFSSVNDQASSSSESYDTVTPIDDALSEEVITTARPSKSEDMATVLEDRLKTIRKIQLRAARLFDYPSESPPAMCSADAQGEPFIPLTITDGSIMRINLDKTIIELNPDTLRAVANVSGGMSTAAVPREVLLDRLLDDHVTAVLKSAKKAGSTLYDVSVPQVDLRLVLGSFQHPESIVHCTLDSPAVRFLETPVPDSTATSSSATAEVRGFCVTLLKQDTSHNNVSLIDVPNFDTAPRGDGILPYVRLAAARLHATFNEEPGKKTVQLKALDCMLQAATPGVPVVSYLVDTWKPVVETLPSHCAGLCVADVIYDVLSETVEEGLTMSLPNFMYESSYALQFNDQRSLRQDIGWFTIARLRHWMRMERQRLESSPQRPPKEEMSKNVMEWLLRLDEPTVNEHVLLAQPYLRKAFGKHLDRAGLTPESRMDSSVTVFFGIDALLLRHYGRLLETGAIAASAITIENVTFGSDRHLVWEGDLPMTTFQALITVGRLAVDLHNSIVSAYDAVLDHIDTHREAIHELPVVHAIDEASRVVVDVHLGDLSAAVSAGGMRLDFVFTGAQASTTVERSRRTEGIAESRCVERNAFLLNCQFVRATLREAVDIIPDDTEKDKDRELVLSVIRGVGCTADSKMDNFDPKGGSARLAFSVDAFEFDSRPQLKAFFDFGQDWRRSHYPLYVPTIEHTKVVNERRKAFQEASPHARPVQPQRGTVLRSMALDLVVRSARMQARAAKRLWLGWDMGQVYAYRNGSPDHLQFGLQVAPQVVGAYPSVNRVKTKDSSIIHLPSITITATYRDPKQHPSLSAKVKLGMFTGILKPAVLDRLLSLHQRLGNDVLAVIREVRGSKESTPHLDVPPTLLTKPVKSPLEFRIQASVDGVRVGLRADNVPPTLMFEALRLQGSASNIEASKLQWTAKANHVGLSIIRMADGPSYQAAEPLRGTRSVSMVLDVSAEETPGTLRTPSKLNITLSRVHTVMHVAALSELGDLIRSWSSDIAVLRKVHHDEVAEVKEQTTRVLKKLDAAHKEREKEKERSRISSSGSASGMSEGSAGIETWFASRLLTLEVTGIGIAIPLDEAAPIDVAKRAGGESGPALLYSVRLISLTTSRTETARFRVQQTLLQFVEKFDSGTSDSFQGTYHRATNYMELPSIESEAQMSSAPGSLSVIANCTASDFKLSLTPDIADGIARLADLYEHGKEHLSAMERDYRAEWAKFEGPDQQPDSLAEKYDLPADHTVGSPQKVHVQVSCRFDSGVVELHRTNEAAHTAKERRMSTHQKPGRWAKEQNLDKFTLPTVSVYADYSGTENTDDHQRTLLFNLAVHESHNVLHPTILPFFVDVVTRVERRAKCRPDPMEQPKPSPESALPITERALERIAEAPTGKLRLRVTLRIDRSELRLSCAPDSSAFVDLKWESGGFVASTLLGGKDTTTLSGSVSGVTAYLSHEFAEQGQGCIEAGAKDLVFNLALCDADAVQDSQQRGLSIVVDTQVGVKFRLDAFSAWLIFMAVWVDAAPKFEVKKPTESPTIPVNPVASSKLGVAVVMRFRSIDFDANVSVTQARLEMTPIIINTVSDGERSKLDLSIGTTLVTAEGDISGNLRSESLKFSTVRRSTRATIQPGDSQLLQMKIEGGDLSGNLFIADTNIVRFQLEPSVVTLVDDWKELATNPSGQVHLDFIVNAGKFSGVLRLPAIPRLLGNFYSIFDMADVQKRIASQRSDAFKRRQKRSSDQMPTTTVVLPMKPQTDATGAEDHVRTAQRMRFELAGLDVGIISDDFDDTNVVAFYRFFIGTVRAELLRQGSEGGLPLRELLLYIDFLQWQSADGNRVTRFESHDMSARELIDRAVAKGWNNVAILPKMNLRMDSTELLNPKTVEYDFDVAWGDTDADIKIMPNFLKAAFNSFRKLVRGIDQQQLDRAKRRGDVRTRQRDEPGPPDEPLPLIRYHRRGEGPFNNPVPKLRAMGDVTGDAAMMVPQIKQALGELPAYSHRFVTLPLEEGMDLLLKLYEHQLPAVAEDDT